MTVAGCTTAAPTLEAIGQVHLDVFADIRPASTIVEVTTLTYPSLLVEVEGDAAVSGRDATESAFAYRSPDPALGDDGEGRHRRGRHFRRSIRTRHRRGIGRCRRLGRRHPAALLKRVRTERFEEFAELTVTLLVLHWPREEGVYAADPDILHRVAGEVLPRVRQL
ncbi:hypothetical protein ACFV0R_23515 [Streptomyces sp. NPDC059578]|uniref:hypothetical protein n=1 Tax=unclassified Streptomyces TaxID=2593676 RepID=UPI0036527C0E